MLKLRPKFGNEEEAYQYCIADGYVKEVLTVNKDKAEALLRNSIISVESADALANLLSQRDEKWMTVYVLYYEALRTCAEAFLLFDKIISSNHQCLFAALCVKHPELELDWGFLEAVRTKRNGVNYYGERVIYSDWKAVEMKMKLYISALKKEIDKKLA